MDWLDIAPFVIAATIVLVGAGLVVTSAARLPLFAKVASAPAVATTVVALTAVVCQVVGTRFGPWQAAVGFAVSAALAWSIRLLLDRLDRRRTGAGSEPRENRAGDASTSDELRPAPEWVTWLAWVGALLLMVRHWRNILGRPDAFSQTYDNIFHMNAIRWIVDTGEGSSIAFAMTSGHQDPMYYPTGWHNVVALTTMLVGDMNVALAVNAVTLVTLGLVWTSGCLFLVRSITSGSTAVMLATGVLSASFAAFPFLLLGFGVLYPNFLGLSLLPAGMALTVHVLRLQSGPPLHLASVVMVGLLVLAGAGLAHPNVLMSYLVVLLPLLAASVWAAVSSTRDSGWARRVGTSTLLLLAALPASWLAWQRVRPAEQESIWTPYLSVPDAVGSGILFAAGHLWPAWVLAFLSMVGVYAAFRWGRNRSFVVAHGLLLGLWVVASAMPAGELRTFLVGVWYNDSYRLASLLPITGLPLAAMGVEQLARLADSPFARVDRYRLIVQQAVAVAFAVVLVMTTQATSWMNRAIDQFADSFALTDDSALVSSDEYAIIEAARELVPVGAVIAANPWNGSSMAYAIAGRDTTTTHVSYVLTSDLAIIKERLDEAASDPAVCEAARRLNVRYALDFGPKEVHGGDHEYTGFDALSEAEGFRRIAQAGDAALYELTACR